jgi:hypothetical protein
MKQEGGRKKPKAKPMRVKMPAVKPAKTKPIVTLPAAWER